MGIENIIPLYWDFLSKLDFTVQFEWLEMELPRKLGCAPVGRLFLNKTSSGKSWEVFCAKPCRDNTILSQTAVGGYCRS